METTLLSSIVIVIGLLSSHVSADWEEYAEEIRRLSENNTSAQSALRANFLRSSKAVGMKNFPCSVSVSSGRIPTSVHELRPSDIKVIGALGDSLTAGNGIDASYIWQVLKQYRGLSWSIGGDKHLEEVTTLPNMLKKYNPNLAGYSIGTGSVKKTEISRLNVAVPGSEAINMVTQARMMIDRMKADKKVDFNNDWKMVTLFVGSNDLCDWVKHQDKFKPENYIANIKSALDLLQKEMPRTFVNLMQIADVLELAENQRISCKVLRLYLCPSAIFSKKALVPVMAKYRQLLRELVASGVYDVKDDFTVVLQPMYEETKIPKKKNSDENDRSYFAPDCFHFSGKGHAAAAKALWNNLFEPVGKKTNSFDPSKDIVLECPSGENPYFYTAKNSQPKQLKSAAAAAPAPSDENDGSRHPVEDTKSKETAPSALPVAFAVVGGVLIVLCIVAAVVMVMRRRRTPESEQTWLFSTSTAQA
ncbi:phospholipase B1, membrane-associated-like [Ptychodera flava]|uniref:phospholipase B1, membrane-associated-like n=1 Tax=Ptychodera flava TaxID=63121 RepID=UPI00396A95A3